MGVGSAVQFMTPQELADVSGMHVGSIRRALSEGRIPGIKLGARWLIKREEVLGPEKGAEGADESEG